MPSSKRTSRTRIAPDKAIYQGAIPGMLRTLDPHSNFLDPEEYRLLQQNQRGQYYGVGMEVMMDGPHVSVVQAFPDSPAARAGLAPRRRDRRGGRSATWKARIPARSPTC